VNAPISTPSGASAKHKSPQKLNPGAENTNKNPAAPAVKTMKIVASSTRTPNKNKNQPGSSKAAKTITRPEQGQKN
jgi:hypothetical protein